MGRGTVAHESSNAYEKNLYEKWGGSGRPASDCPGRVCQICKTGAVETELHFLLECAAYEDLRNQRFCEIAFVDPSFLYLSKEQAFVYLMSDQLHVELYSRVGYYFSSFYSRRHCINSGF